MYPINDYRSYLKHSAKGTTWKKKNPKYVFFENGRYYYPEDVGAEVVGAKAIEKRKNYKNIEEAKSAGDPRKLRREAIRIEAYDKKGKRRVSDARAAIIREKAAQERAARKKRIRLRQLNKRPSGYKNIAAFNARQAEDELRKRKSKPVSYHAKAAKAKLDYAFRKLNATPLAKAVKAKTAYVKRKAGAKVSKIRRILGLN